MEPSVAGIVGVDFGTTNSSIAYSDGGQVRMVSFPSALGESRSSRSLLYFQRRMKAAAKSVSAWTGPRAIEEYLAHDNADESVQGRLIQSLKSHLSDSSLTGSEVFGRRYFFEDLVALILRDLRACASEVFGFEVTRAVVGRPVMFVGAESESDNESPWSACENPSSKLDSRTFVSPWNRLPPPTRTKLTRAVNKSW